MGSQVMRAMQIGLLAMMPVAAANTACCKEVSVCHLGRTEMRFPSSYGVAFQKQQPPRDWDFSVRSRMAASNPFRDDVQFGWLGRGNRFRVIHDDQTCSPCTWYNVGFYLRRVDNASHLGSLLGVLHVEWPEAMLTARQVRRVLGELERNSSGLPFALYRHDVDADLLEKGCFVKEGVWFCNFILLEGASLIEYKYAVDQRNRVARRRQVLAEGPRPPVTGALTLPAHYNLENEYPDELLGGLGLQHKDLTTAVPHAECNWYDRCRSFLVGATRFASWRLALCAQDAWIRREAIRVLPQAALDSRETIPDLCTALADPDAETRIVAADALRGIGPQAKATAAVAALKEALGDSVPAVRDAAKQALAEIER